MSKKYILVRPKERSIKEEVSLPMEGSCLYKKCLYPRRVVVYILKYIMNSLGGRFNLGELTIS
jgi:hypothetical protein